MACPSDKHNHATANKLKPDTGFLIADDDFIESLANYRLPICNACPLNNKNICTPIAFKHSPEKARIDDGVRRLSCKCPKGKWPEVKRVCPYCSRYERVDENKGMCNWCYDKRNTNRYNKNPLIDNRDHIINPYNFDDEPIKNLHYFLYPRYEESTSYHLEQLEKSIDIFNGKRVCCVATDQNTLQEHFKTKLRELFTDILYLPNNSHEREKVGFLPALHKLISKNRNHVICFAHAKGQQPHTSDSANIRLWSDAMYETCLRNWDEVKAAMIRGYPVAGSFKSTAAFQTALFKWHYSGSFWWGRSKKIFENKRWRDMCQRWWATESYVGRHFTREEGYCLFRPLYSGESLYDDSTWKSVLKDLEIWRQDYELFAKDQRNGARS